MALLQLCIRNVEKSGKRFHHVFLLHNLDTHSFSIYTAYNKIIFSYLLPNRVSFNSTGSNFFVRRKSANQALFQPAENENVHGHACANILSYV